MDSTENDRRVAALVHTALLAAVGVYAVVLVFFRAEIEPEAPKLRAGPALFRIFAALGGAQFFGAWLVGRRLLRLPRLGARDRVRLYFLLRAAAAEAIALYGFVLGFLGGSVAQVVAILALSVAALLACTPGREKWEEALRRAQSEGREPGAGNR